MQPCRALKPPNQGVVIYTEPLTREAFAPFGDVVDNPRPDVHPSAAVKAPPSLLAPFNAVVANQGSAIKYQHVSHQVDLYSQAPSGRPGSAAMSMFVCAARARVPDSSPNPAATPGPAQTQAESTFTVSILERHPFTTQTFVPLTADPAAHYLVVVTPTLPPTDEEAPLPVPHTLPPSARYPRPLPGAGMPDLRRLRAFVATATQAVTYGAGTWHAPMVALGDAGTAVDFVVVQFANGVAVEDCQEVFQGAETRPSTGTEGGILVRLRALTEHHGKRPGKMARL